MQQTPGGSEAGLVAGDAPSACCVDVQPIPRSRIPAVTRATAIHSTARRRVFRKTDRKQSEHHIAPGGDRAGGRDRDHVEAENVEPPARRP